MKVRVETKIDIEFTTADGGVTVTARTEMVNMGGHALTREQVETIARTAAASVKRELSLRIQDPDAYRALHRELHRELELGG